MQRPLKVDQHTHVSFLSYLWNGHVLLVSFSILQPRIEEGCNFFAHLYVRAHACVCAHTNVACVPKRKNFNVCMHTLVMLAAAGCLVLLSGRAKGCTVRGVSYLVCLFDTELGGDMEPCRPPIEPSRPPGPIDPWRCGLEAVALHVWKQQEKFVK